MKFYDLVKQLSRKIVEKKENKKMFYKYKKSKSMKTLK